MLFRKLFAIMLFVAIVPLGISAYYQIRINREGLQDQILELHNAKAEMVAQSINDYLANIRNNLDFIVRTQDLGGQTREQRERSLATIVREYREIQGMMIVRPDGSVALRAFLPYAVGTEEDVAAPESRADLEGALESPDGISVSRVYPDPNRDELMITVAQRLERPDDEQELLVTQIGLGPVQELAASVTVGRRGSTFVVDADGRLVAGPEPERVLAMESMTGLSIVDEALKSPLSGSGDFVDDEGVRRMGAYAPILWLDWRVVVHQPSSDAYISATKMQNQTIYWIVIGALFAALGGAYFARSINRPVKKLVDGARAIAERNYDVTVDVKTRDEIGQLADTFNFMAGRVKYFDELNVEKIIEEKDKTTAIIHSIADGILVTDVERKIILLNPVAERIFNTSFAEAFEKSLLESINVVQLYDAVSRELAGGAQQFSLDVTLPDVLSGRDLVYKVVGAPVLSGDKAIGFVMVFRDITHEKEVDRMKTEFVNMASHELRTPLGSVKLYTEMLIDDEDMDEMHKESLQTIFEETERLTRLVNEMLDISRIEAGKTKVNPAPMKIQDVAAKAEKMLASKAAEKSFAIHNQVPADLPEVVADPDMLSQVVINLVSNSIKYAPEGREAWMRARVEDGELCMEVEDTGFGMPEEAVTQVFDKFYRVETDETRNIEGTGLGLPMVKQIIELHGGRIWVESQMGKGSKFAFVIPTAPPAGEEG